MCSKRSSLAAVVKKVPQDRLACLFQEHITWPQQFVSKRNRLYTMECTFWLFLAQVLHTGSSCQEAVSRFLAGRAVNGQRASANSASYCEARARLPQACLEQVFSEVTGKSHAHANEAENQWCGRRVKVVDGSSVSMPDTKENQALYPQPEGQMPGCGFPVARLTVIFCLATGVVLTYAKAALSTGERTLFRALWDSLQAGEVILADRGFCSYAEMYLLGQRGVDTVMRKHQRRGKTSRVHKRLAKNDAVMSWMKTKSRPEWLDEDVWLTMPETLLVREVTLTIGIPGFRTRHIEIATSLLDPKTFPKRDLEQLYHRRWMAELGLRDLKTTMGMEVLRCKSPEMVHKELTMHFIAYNLLRSVMLNANKRPSSRKGDISFKSALATMRQWAPQFESASTTPRKRRELYRILLEALAQNRLPQRPNRHEPRAKKRRPKNYPLLNKPREEFVEIPHRSKYRAS